MGKPMRPKISREHGRMELHVHGGTARLVLENVNREGDHWLTLERGVGSSASVIGYLRLKPIAGDRHTFEVAEVRPACTASFTRRVTSP